MNTVPTTRPAATASSRRQRPDTRFGPGTSGCSRRSPSRLPASSPTSSPDASTPCQQPFSTASSPAQGSAPHSGRCSATAASAAVWIPATAVGLGAGLAAGAALVSYETDITSLAMMGAVSGSRSASPKARRSPTPSGRSAGSLPTPRCGRSGWTVTTAGGIDVSQQWAVFGAYGCLTLAFLQSTIIGAFVPARR